MLIAQVPLVIIPIIVAAVIAASVAPLYAGLQRRGWSAGRAAATVIGGTFLLLLFVIVLADTSVRRVRSSKASGIDRRCAAGELDDLRRPQALVWLAGTIGAQVVGAIGTVVEVVGTLALVLVLSPILAFYLLRDAPRGWAQVISRATPWRRTLLHEGGVDATEILGGYMLGTAAISAVGAISQLLIMLLLGLPFAVPIAILSFIACFIPYIGGFVTTGLAFLIAVAYGTPLEIGIMFVYTIVFNLVQGNIVTPLVYSRTVSLHPAVVLLSIPAGAALAGIAGMFLIVPILAVISSTWRSVVLLLGRQAGGPTGTIGASGGRGQAGAPVLVPKPAD